MPLELPNCPIKACIFDCDGTLADTMPLHYTAWCQALAPHHCPFPEDQFYSLGGVSTKKIIQILNEQHQLSMPVDVVTRIKEEIYHQLLPTVKPIENTLEWVHHFSKTMPLAVASGGNRQEVQQTLHLLGITSKFQTVVASEDYLHGKPHPDPFLEAARRLQIPPKDCLVFEDTALGIQAATAAQMHWVHVSGNFKIDYPKHCQASEVCPSLNKTVVAHSGNHSVRES